MQSSSAGAHARARASARANTHFHLIRFCRCLPVCRLPPVADSPPPHLETYPYMLTSDLCGADGASRRGMSSCLAWGPPTATLRCGTTPRSCGTKASRRRRTTSRSCATLACANSRWTRPYAHEHAHAHARGTPMATHVTCPRTQVAMAMRIPAAWRARTPMPNVSLNHAHACAHASATVQARPLLSFGHQAGEACLRGTDGLHLLHHHRHRLAAP